MLRRYRLALGLWLCAVAMVFVAFISAYVVRGGVPNYELATGTYSTQWEPPFLPVSLLILNSCVLLAASGALELARRKACRAIQTEVATGPSLPIWVLAAALLSAAFVAGQARAWQILRGSGHTIASGARAAFFYVTSGAHGIQIVALVLLLFWIVGRQTRWQATRKFIAVDLSAWYLHAMNALWILLFCVLLWV
jgi:heme/copper-type cytochrome/quinol oxidase subunit 3